MKKILVVGSLNMDLVTSTLRHPKLGETIIGDDFHEVPGGKGGNQGVAIAKLGGDITMFGCVGDDSYGDKLIKELRENNIETKYIIKKTKNTGIATITVDKSGDNKIIVIPGANFEITKGDVDKNIDLIKNSDIILLQLEIPLEVVEYILEKSKENNKVTVLNPAPAKELSKKIIRTIDYLIPNETELNLLSEMPTESKDEVIKASKNLLEKGVKNLIVTRGKKGSIFISKDNIFEVEGKRVKSIDSTAAGDSFIGGFLTMIAKGESIESSMEFGSKVGAITVTKKGAQTSLPTLKEVEDYKFQI